jgi:GAF domain-containing protein
MFEDGQALDIAPFPTGEGLTSIVIRTRRPLLLVEDTVRQAEALGARTIGVPAKSWLGVPMLFGGQVIGVIIVQDIHQEHRFDQEDERLLSTLATQVAVVVRNASLLEKSSRQARQERLINEINAKIRQSVDIQSILNTTATELGQALGASRLHIQVGAPDEAEEERSP